MPANLIMGSWNRPPVNPMRFGKGFKAPRKQNGRAKVYEGLALVQYLFDKGDIETAKETLARFEFENLVKPNLDNVTLQFSNIGELLL